MPSDSDRILYGRMDRPLREGAGRQPEEAILTDDERLALRSAALILEEAGDDAERDGEQIMSAALHQLADRWKGFSVSHDPSAAETIAADLHENVSVYADCLDEEWGPEAEADMLAIADRMSC